MRKKGKGNKRLGLISFSAKISEGASIVVEHCPWARLPSDEVGERVGTKAVDGREDRKTKFERRELEGRGS